MQKKLLWVYIILFWQLTSGAMAVVNASSYTDPKGFFKVNPPDGWVSKEYPADPRSKVSFEQPNSSAIVSILVKAVDIKDYKSLIESLKAKEAELGIKTNIEPIIFNGFPAVKRSCTITMQGVSRQFLWVDLLINGYSHNVQYGAPPAEFNKYRDVAWKSIQTYRPLQKNEVASTEDVKKHEAAKWISVAKIALEWGKVQAAKDAVSAGLAADPGNAELLQLQAKLKQ